MSEETKTKFEVWATDKTAEQVFYKKSHLFIISISNEKIPHDLRVYLIGKPTTRFDFKFWNAETEPTENQIFERLAVLVDEENKKIAKQRKEDLDLIDQFKKDPIKAIKGYTEWTIRQLAKEFPDFKEASEKGIEIIRKNEKEKIDKIDKKSEAEEAEKIAEKEKWILENGSERLKLCVQEDIEYGGILKTEFLKKKMTEGWELWDFDETNDFIPRNPSLEALKFIIEVKKESSLTKDAELFWDGDVYAAKTSIEKFNIGQVCKFMD